MHSNSKLLFAKYGRRFIRTGARLLEIGPDAFPSTYAKLVNDQTVTWETVDLYESKELTYSATSEYSFPIADDSYEVVLAGQVIEHVRKIWVWVKEIERICKKGGYVILINPVSWPYHEAPIDCWRIYPEGMKALLEDTRLRIVETRFESLEVPGYKRYTPGVSAGHTPKRRLIYQLTAPIGLIGFPIERSYDTITIAQKE